MSENEISEIAKGATLGRTILAYLSSPVAVLSRNMNVAYANPAFEKAFNVVLTDILGKDFGGIFGSDVARRLARDISDVLEQGLTNVLDLSYGSNRYSATISAIKEGQDGPLLGVVVTLNNITAEKKLAEARANFITMVLEDLKSPAIETRKNIRELKNLASSSKKIRDIVDKMDQDAGKMLNVINEFFQLGSSVDGEVVLDRKNIAVSQLLSEVILGLANTAKDRGIVFDTVCPSSFQVNVDETKLSAALINLCFSAIRSTPKGGVVMLYVEPDDSPGYNARLVITTTSDEVYEEDFRELSKGGLNPDMSSPDIGLVASARIIEAHEGSIMPVGVRGAGLSLVINF